MSKESKLMEEKYSVSNPFVNRVGQKIKFEINVVTLKQKYLMKLEVLVTKSIRQSAFA